MMQESHPVAARIAALGLGVGLLLSATGCDAELPEKGQAIERCYDQPLGELELPDQTADASRRARASSEVDVTIDADGDAKNAPKAASASLYRTVSQSLVQVRITASRNPEHNSTGASGSGWLAAGQDGDQLVVTAGHVAADATDTAGLRLTTDNGQTVGVAAACYITETNGVFSDPRDDTADQIDVAVLVPKAPLQAKPLILADEIPPAGDWTYAINYQGTSKPGDPANVAVVIGGKPPLEVYNGISGLNTLDDDTSVSGYQTNHVVAGASGGPLVDESGAVIGITVASTTEKSSPTTSYLEQSTNIHLTGPGADLIGSDFGPRPSIVYLVGPRAIQAALAARLSTN